MDTNREDFSIAIRSAFLKRETKQRFSLFLLVLFAVILILIEKIETKPLNSFRSIIKDVIYRTTDVVSYPIKGFGDSLSFINNHLGLYKNYKNLKKENEELKSRISEYDFLTLENSQLKKLIDDKTSTFSNLVSSRVMFDKESPYLNSFIINIGANKNLKKGMAVLDGNNFIGRLVDVNFFSSRVLLVSDLNSKIPVMVEPSGAHGILSGHGSSNPTLEYLPENHKIKQGDKVYTSGKEGIFSPGVSIGEIVLNKKEVEVELFSDLSQIFFVNVDLGDTIQNK